MRVLSSENLHASCVAINGRAVLLVGLPGSGKSDLALRLLDRGAKLVSDDRTVVKRTEAGLVACAPATIEGKIEVRGLGIIDLPVERDVSVALIVSLDGLVDRLPDAERWQTIAGVAIPLIALAALEASAPLKVEYALARLELKA